MSNIKYILFFLKVIIDILIAAILTLVFVFLIIIVIKVLTGKAPLNELINIINLYIEKWMP